MEDPDPLPDGFYSDPSRRCQFYGLERTAGETGIAWAVFFQALADGVNEKFLRFIARFYELQVPGRYFEMRPAERLKIYPHPMIMQRRPTARGQKRVRIALTWLDGLSIGRSHLQGQKIAV